jgi:hypothetical protein
MPLCVLRSAYSLENTSGFRRITILSSIIKPEIYLFFLIVWWSLQCLGEPLSKGSYHGGTVIGCFPLVYGRRAVGVFFLGILLRWRRKCVQIITSYCMLLVLDLVAAARHAFGFGRVWGCMHISYCKQVLVCHDDNGSKVILFR